MSEDFAFRLNAKGHHSSHQEELVRLHMGSNAVLVMVFLNIQPIGKMEREGFYEKESRTVRASVA
jgi:hypothetical protein